MKKTNPNILTEPGGSPIKFVGKEESIKISKIICDHLKSKGLMNSEGMIRLNRRKKINLA